MKKVVLGNDTADSRRCDGEIITLFALPPDIPLVAVDFVIGADK